MKKYRHEYKYLISDIEALEVSQRLKPIMSIDDNTIDGYGLYRISSLYYDDSDFNCLLDNINGIEPREKIRVRIYNNDTSLIKLERKRKKYGMIFKESGEISLDVYGKIFKCEYGEIASLGNGCLNEIILRMHMRMMMPVVVISYDRMPFIYEAGNVRITIDSNMSYSMDKSRFLEGCIREFPVLPCGYQILEVKWDEFIPDYIYTACQLDNLTQTPFSKYCYCMRIQNREVWI